MTQQADQKIATITDPEPDTNTMKLDLLYKTVPGWTFNNASDIKQMQILNTTKVPNRIEYTVDFKLLNQSFGTGLHDAQIVLIYFYNGDTWSQVGVNESYITYDYVIPADNYVNIQILPNCSWNAPNTNNLSWKLCNDYYMEYKSGPQLPKLTIPASTCYSLKSLDGAAVTLTFTFRPTAGGAQGD